MAKKLSFADLSSRMQTHAKDNNLFIFSVMKGATMAMAGLSLLTIVNGIVDDHYEYAWRLLFWIVAMAATILTYNAASVFSNILVHMPKWQDIVIHLSSKPPAMLV